MMSYRGWLVLFCCLLSSYHGNAWQDTCIIGCACAGTTIECRGLERETFPANLDPDTEVLRIRDSKISYIQRNALAKMRRLQVLEIYSSEIIYIQTCAFAGISNFTSVTFSRNNITSIVQNAFAVIENVQDLVFEDSVVGTIATRAFTKLRDVMTFRFTNLTVNKLEREAVDDVSGIKNFQIDFNKFGYVGQSPLNNLANVTLNMSGNIFPSHCGVADIFPDTTQETSVSIYFRHNVIKLCACNMSLLVLHPAPVADMDQNICSGPPEVAGIFFTELSETPFCRAAGANRTTHLWCPVTRQMPVHHNCHAFGSPLIPLEEVEDPRVAEDKNGNNIAPNFQSNLYMFSITFTLLSIFSY
ncbi:slit homolog 2 protein-like [Pecten maximus]|uniref:slit homolog 2 protein-like n=1 Tax=Pecten maximus TaxID=6579 RepID=UPI0014586554|nr:slit homolog 2 protein-like [Pecten maximus]